MHTFTSTDSAPAWEQVADYVTGTAPDAYRLTALEAVMDGDLHGVWLDEQACAVWHAWAADSDAHETGAWYLDSEPAANAVEWIEEQCCLVLDAITDPEVHYDTGNRTAEDDLEVVDELNAVRLAAMSRAGEAEIARARADGSKSADGFTVPQAVDGELRRRIDQARREVGMLADLRASYLSRLAGNDRGGVARVARDVGITEGAIRKVIAAAERRREQIISAARAAKENHS